MNRKKTLILTMAILIVAISILIPVSSAHALQSNGTCKWLGRTAIHRCYENDYYCDYYYTSRSASNWYRVECYSSTTGW